MRLSLSTRGWNHIPWQKLTSVAGEAGFTGIEIYDIQKLNEYSQVNSIFSKSNVAQTNRSLGEKHLSVCNLDSSIDFSDPDLDMSNVKNNLCFAADMKIPHYSFFVKEENIDLVKSRIKEILPLAESYSVVLLIKTSGIYANTDKLRLLLDEFASDNLGALWDVHHTYRDGKEDLWKTIENLGAYIHHVHLRDSDDSGNYEIVGEGTFPIEDFIRSLNSVDYDGYISLEWKTAWLSNMTDFEFICSHYIFYMKKYEHKENQKRLYLNHDGTGQYIWKKDELIDLTFSKLLDRLVEEFPDQYAFKYSTLDYTRTYREFRNDVNDFARTLVSMGVKPGNKVSIWATNVPEWFISFWAVTKIGAILVSVNTAYKSHEIEYLLRQSDTHTLIMIESSKDSNYREIMNELCPEIKDTEEGKPLHCKRLPFLRNIITVGFKMPGCLTFNKALKRKDLVPITRIQSMAANVKPLDVCNMQYTSGTTGFPKGVMLTHYSVINNGKCIGDRMGLSTADRMMIQVPMFHCFGMVLSMTASFTHGTTMCPLPYFSAKASLDCINIEKITCFNGVPTMFIAMFNHPQYKKTDFSHMRTGIMAGSGCPPELMRRAAKPDEMNMTGIVSVYGQTESSPGSTMSSWTDPLDVRCDTVGYAFPHVICKIVNPETGEEVPNNVNGEFCSKGYNTMKGYYKMPLATKETVDSDGWLHSGDIAMRDDDGNYYITGRLKDMIIRGGENIYPKEIEEFIYTHPSVKDVQVVGVKDEKYGEEIAACIIPKENMQLTEDEMRLYIEKSLARHKVPKYIYIVSSFPMNAAGKVLKYKIKENIEKSLLNN